MAKTPTKKQVKKLLEKSTTHDERKKVSQQKRGKEFVNHGQGVIPETVWKELPGKKLEDPEAVK